jgi:molybdenum cofactor guanylyltransferase
MSTADVTVAVLAGGRSVRFGSDKRLAPIDGTTLLGRTLALAHEVGDDVLLVVADAQDGRALAAALDLRASGTRLMLDTRHDVGPLAGLEAALMAAANELVLVLAGDHPRLGRELLDLVVTTARHTPHAAAVALAGRLGPEPMLTVYRRAALTDVRAMIDAGARRMVDVLSALEPTIIDESSWRTIDPNGTGLVDVDTPEDLADLM